ncbi:MAG: hypothetical protein VKL59_01715, partial [Nostocaceae cyanobacterium]|nr:hypothetical protein [Nostocaceae cyanobacterium]
HHQGDRIPITSASAIASLLHKGRSHSHHISKAIASLLSPEIPSPKFLQISQSSALTPVPSPNGRGVPFRAG